MSIDTSATSPPSGPAPERNTGSITIDGISYIPSSVLLTGIAKVSFKDNRAFAVVDPLGEAPRIYSNTSELGFYYNDTRYLGVWELTVNGERPVGLAHELRFQGSTVVFSMTNPDMPLVQGPGRIPRDMLLIRRVLTLREDTLFETVEVKNFDNRPHLLQIEHWCGGSFLDIFEVRGFPRGKRGRMLPVQELAECDDCGPRKVTVLQYEGLDGVVRRTFFNRLYEAEKVRVSPSLVGHFARVNVPAKETAALKSVVSFDRACDCRFLGQHYGSLSVPEKMRLLARETDEDPIGALRFESDNELLNRAIQSAQTDLFMLLTEEPSKHLYPYAGIPWFSAPFGRDGMISAYQLLPWYPDLARGVLDYAFRSLGSREDPFTEEEPGKVFHEMRHGEMARTREVPFIPYYGSVDSTPLCLILLHEYVRWTMDLESLRNWWPDALRALAWIEKWGDSDGDGFLEYAMHSPNGLVNQGWKDSHDSVMHADGKLARAPIRLCEVQAYAYRARRGMSELARLLGQDELSARLRLEALQLRAAFVEKFWNPYRGTIALALDWEGRPCDVRSSNMGHCLWGGILDHEQARSAARHLMSEAMFSGYGIRTLADTEVSYNPLSYHNGSIWPHDNSLIMEGFRSYGLIPELRQLSVALMDVLEFSQDFRLPELFCGFRRRGNEPPVPYQVACKPQAWAAGSLFLMIRSILGISMDPDQHHLVFNTPMLTPKTGLLEIKGLRGRDWEIDLRIHGGGGTALVEVSRRVGQVRVLTVR